MQLSSLTDAFICTRNQIHKSSKTIAAGVFTIGLVLNSGQTSAATIEITGTIRDFCAPDISSICTQLPDFEGAVATEKGIVDQNLGQDQKPVYNVSVKGVDGESSATTSGVDNFNKWYNDTLGFNVSAPVTITLDNAITSDPNVYTFISNNFFPIDNQLFGNQGRTHNYHFTYEIHANFTYNGGEVFQFFGDDDLFLFLNNQLAVDLGGVHSSQSASVDLDAVAGTLGIEEGNIYNFDLFFAERHTVSSVFRIDTSIALTQIPLPAALPLFVFGLMSLFGISRSRCWSRHN